MSIKNRFKINMLDLTENHPEVFIIYKRGIPRGGSLMITHVTELSITQNNGHDG